MRKEQLERTNRYKQKIANLYRKNQITTTDITNLQRSIDRMQTDLQIFDQHSIDVICNPSLTCSINIRMNINNWKSSDTSSSSSTSSSIIRQLEFRLKYVSLSGFVSSHYVLVHVNGTIGDLIDQFIQIEDKILINNRRREFFLATEISQNRLRQRFSNDIQLNMIFNQIHELVLYETPFELNTMNLQKYCLILSTFQDGLPWEMKFGLPILLKVPRFQCRGKDVINELDKILEKSLPCMINQQNKISYEVKIVAENQQVNPATILNGWADEVIDDHLLMADNATLIVNLVNDGKVTMKDQSVRLARLDGILKNGEKRRKSRK
ncbi:hypothetical protein I4U23_010390 [Adineta vaga]|nr:hypothetical protein I4U23_010390 [Adineta vaga]